MKLNLCWPCPHIRKYGIDSVKEGSFNLETSGIDLDD